LGKKNAAVALHRNIRHKYKNGDLNQRSQIRTIIFTVYIQRHGEGGR